MLTRWTREQIYRAAGAPVPGDGAAVEITAQDRGRFGEVSVGLTPRRVSSILDQANSGDPREQAKLALEMEERNWDIAAALQQRRAAVCSTPWSLVPADDSAAAKQIADTLTGMLREAQGDPWDEDVLSFPNMLAALLTAYLPGYALCETLWGAGGKTITGWQFIEPWHISFQSSRQPLLVTSDAPQGRPLNAFGPAKFVWHRYRHRAGDPTRGGLIRPLVWPHVFMLWQWKDWLRYLEKYGIPFLLVQMDDATWKSERAKVQRLIQTFGADGGAALTKGMTVTMEAPVNRPSQAFQEFIGEMKEAIVKLVLGQTSTSSSQDSNRSTADVHNLVRMDLRADDCTALAGTTKQCLLTPATRYQFGEAAVPLTPTMQFELTPPADLKQDSEVLGNLSEAGFEADPEEVSKRFGYRLTRKAAPAPAAAQPATLFSAIAPEVNATDAMVTGLVEAATAKLAAGDAAVVRAWIGPVERAIAHVIAAEDDAEFRRRLAALPAQVPELYQQMDSRGLEAVLQQVSTTAYAQGMASRAAALAAKEGREPRP